MIAMRMICRCCAHTNDPADDYCVNCGELMYDTGEWAEEWNEGDDWYNEEDGGDGASAYTGVTTDSTRMPLERARCEFQDDWDLIMKQRMVLNQGSNQLLGPWTRVMTSTLSPIVG